MWNLIPVQLAGGVGNGNLFLSKTRILASVAIPTQVGINSGVTRCVISHILPDGPATPFPVLTLNTVVAPYCNIPQKLGVDPSNTPGTQLLYQLVGSINVSITGGVLANVVNVWVLLNDD